MARFTSVSEEGIPQLAKHVSDWNNYYVDDSWNGKHVYFEGGGWDAVYIPDDASLNLPIGHTFTIITDNNSYVYLNANDSNLTYLSAVAVDDAPNGYDITQRSMVTVIKVDANRWIASGYGMSQD